MPDALLRVELKMKAYRSVQPLAPSLSLKFSCKGCSYFALMLESIGNPETFLLEEKIESNCVRAWDIPLRGINL